MVCGVLCFVAFCCWLLLVIVLRSVCVGVILWQFVFLRLCWMCFWFRISVFLLGFVVGLWLRWVCIRFLFVCWWRFFERVYGFGGCVGFVGIFFLVVVFYFFACCGLIFGVRILVLCSLVCFFVLMYSLRLGVLFCCVFFLSFLGWLWRFFVLPFCVVFLLSCFCFDSFFGPGGGYL